MEYKIDVYEDKNHIITDEDDKNTICAVFFHYDSNSKLFVDGVANISDMDATKFHSKLKDGTIDLKRDTMLGMLIMRELCLIGIYDISGKKIRYDVFDFLLGSHGVEFYKSVKIAGTI
nr:MAG TPA: hypothetical protein [Caudoviricetes sp.]